MKLETFVLYSYISIMLPILIAMLIGLIILSISQKAKDKEEERLKFEEFIYILQCKSNKELMALKNRYTSYLTDSYLKSRNDEWNRNIKAIEEHMEKRNETRK